MKKVTFVLILLFAGCAPSRTRIVWHDGKKIEIYSQGKTMVTVKINGEEVIVDGRTSSLIRDVTQAIILRETQPNR